MPALICCQQIKIAGVATVFGSPFVFGVERLNSSSRCRQDDISAFQLIEFDVKFNNVKKFHRDCVAALKTFWHIFYRHKKTFRGRKRVNDSLVDKVTRPARASANRQTVLGGASSRPLECC